MGTIQDLKYKFNNLDIFDKIIAINVVVFIIGLVFKSLFRIDLFTYLNCHLASWILSFSHGR